MVSVRGVIKRAQDNVLVLAKMTCLIQASYENWWTDPIKAEIKTTTPSQRCGPSATEFNCNRGNSPSKTLFKRGCFSQTPCLGSLMWFALSSFLDCEETILEQSFWSCCHYPHLYRCLLRKWAWVLGQTLYHYWDSKTSCKSRCEDLHWPKVCF